MPLRSLGSAAFNSVICTTPRFYHKNHEIRSSLNGPLVVSGGASGTSVLASSNSGRREGEDRRVDSKWRTRALARTAVEEGVAEAKRVIDEVLRSKGGDGAGCLAEVSWALYADEETKQSLEDAVTKLGACRGQDFGEFLRSADSHGVWEVFYAPHIFRSNAVP
jgi:hypothetical protein